MELAVSLSTYQASPVVGSPCICIKVGQLEGRSEGETGSGSCRGAGWGSPLQLGRQLSVLGAQQVFGKYLLNK